MRLGAAWVLPLVGIQSIQMLAMAAGSGGALLVAWNAAKRANQERGAQWREFLPWAMILLLLTVLAVMIFLLPMEMRGNALG